MIIMDYNDRLLKVNFLLFNQFLFSNSNKYIYLETLRKELEPLTTKVEHLHQSHNERYNKLKKVENRLKTK